MTLYTSTENPIRTITLDVDGTVFDGFTLDEGEWVRLNLLARDCVVKNVISHGQQGLVCRSDKPVPPAPEVELLRFVVKAHAEGKYGGARVTILSPAGNVSFSQVVYANDTIAVKG